MVSKVRRCGGGKNKDGEVNIKERTQTICDDNGGDGG